MKKVEKLEQKIVNAKMYSRKQIKLLNNYVSLLQDMLTSGIDQERQHVIQNTFLIRLGMYKESLTVFLGSKKEEELFLFIKNVKETKTESYYDVLKNFVSVSETSYAEYFPKLNKMYQTEQAILEQEQAEEQKRKDEEKKKQLEELSNKLKSHENYQHSKKLFTHLNIEDTSGLDNVEGIKDNSIEDFIFQCHIEILKDNKMFNLSSLIDVFHFYNNNKVLYMFVDLYKYSSKVRELFNVETGCSNVTDFESMLLITGSLITEDDYAYINMRELILKKTVEESFDQDEFSETCETLLKSYYKVKAKGNKVSESLISQIEQFIDNKLYLEDIDMFNSRQLYYARALITIYTTRCDSLNPQIVFPAIRYLFIFTTNLYKHIEDSSLKEHVQETGYKANEELFNYAVNHSKIKLWPLEVKLEFRNIYKQVQGMLK